MEKDNFFDGFTPDAEAVPDDQAIVETTGEQTPVETETPPEPVQAPVEPVKPEPGHVPITALLDEREKRKEMERRLAEYEARQQQAPVPDPNLDPYGYQQHLAERTQQDLLDSRLWMSEEMARGLLGDELTDKAKEWALEKFRTNPAFQAEVLAQPHPYGYAIKAYQRDQIASNVTPDDYTQFQAWKAAQAQLAAAPVEAPVPQTPVPKSIASAPSAGGVSTQPPPTDEEAFGAIFS